MDEFDALFLIPRHPVMRPKPDFIDLPVDLGFQASVEPLPEHVAMRVVNRATDE